MKKTRGKKATQQQVIDDLFIALNNIGGLSIRHNERKVRELLKTQLDRLG